MVPTSGERLITKSAILYPNSWRASPMAYRNSRRRARKTDRSMVVGIGWYDATQWARLKEVAVDSDRLDDSHETWQRTAEE
jgi:hypothetical protein